MKLFINRTFKFLKEKIKSIYSPKITLGDIVQIVVAIIALIFVFLEFKESIEQQTQNIETKINMAINPPEIGIGEVYRFDDYLSYIKLDSFDVNYTKAYLTYSIRNRKRHESLELTENYIISELPDIKYNVILKNINKEKKKAEFLITEIKKEK